MAGRQKATNVRRGIATIGKMSRSAGGFITMVYEDAVDLGNAPEIFITGIAKIEQIGPGTLRVSLYSQRGNEKIVVVHEIWDSKVWDDAVNIAEDAKGAMKYGRTRVIGDGAPQSKEAH